jgi:hypothetical protein
MGPALIAAVVAAPMLSGCQTTSARGPVVLDAPDDRCAVHRAAFRSTEPTFESAAQNAALAVGAGVVAGVLTTAVTGSSRAGLIVGGSIAGVGLAATLINANIQQMEADQRRDALLNQTAAVNRFGERVSGAQLALEQLSGCRRDQVRTVQADVRGRRMPEEEGRARLAAIRQWYDGDLVLVRAFNERLATDSTQLAESTRFINSAGLEVDPPFRPYAGIVATPVRAKQQASATAPDGPGLQPGQTLRVVGREGGWLRVAVPGQGSRPAYVQSVHVAQEIQPAVHQGASAQRIRAAALDEAEPVGDVATGSTYRVVGRMTGWLVVDNAGRRSFVRASALRPASVDESGADVVQATASAIASRNAFSSGTQTFEAEARRVALDT